jgi:16S rRNA (cytosine1402-N4)-methyltransferase
MTDAPIDTPIAAEFSHVSVMLPEVLQALAPHSGGFYVDATLGGAGHARAILEASAPLGRLVGIDRDPFAVRIAGERLAEFGDRAQVIHGDQQHLAQILRSINAPPLDGLIADLGVSSPQLDHAERGFSFSKAGPLDMRMDTTRGETAAELLARLDEGELADVLFQYGDERQSRKIARSIQRALEAGELSTTEDLRRAVVRVLGPRRAGKMDPATRTFQALRIAVNGELEQLHALLDAVPDLLADGGVVAVISFQSHEDRMVKRAFRDDGRLEPLTKRPLVAGDEEQERNPRSRSAKLRVARRRPRELSA